MKRVKVSFAIRDGRFTLRATIPGTVVRNYRTLTNLGNPNLESWDPKKQRFMEASTEAIETNAKLDAILKLCDRLIDDYNPIDGVEMLSLYDKATWVETTKELTFGVFVEQLIASMREAKHKKPSKNYQAYITFLNALQEQNTVVRKPVGVVSNNDFIAFSNWVLDVRGGANYLGLMKRFKSVHNKAVSQELNLNVLRLKRQSPWMLPPPLTSH